MRKARELKLMARQRIPKNFGTLVGATAIYGGIYGFVVMALAIAYTLNLMTKGVFTSMASVEMYMDSAMDSFSYFLIMEGVMCLVGALMSTLSVAILYMCLKSVRGQEVKLSDLLYVVKNNPDKVIIIYVIQQLLMFIVSLPANLLSYFADTEGNATFQILLFAFTILNYVADICIAALFAVAMFVYIDNPQLGVVECIEKSNHLMKNNIIQYVLLVLSFVPLYIMSALTFFVLFLFVYPYIQATMALFYMQLNDELGSTIDVTVE